MTKRDFLCGLDFNYVGHFNRLKLDPLSYNAVANSVTDHKAEYDYQVEDIDEKGITLYNQAFGRIKIAFTECSLKKIKP